MGFVDGEGLEVVECWSRLKTRTLEWPAGQPSELGAIFIMPNLQNAKIYRAGSTAPHLNYENSSCSVRVDQRDKTLNFRFNLRSKGGGITSVLLKIGDDNFEAILEEIATNLPENVGALSDCASMANKKNLELLEIARKVLTDEKERAKTIIDDLEPVEEFVSQKYNDAPAGEDEAEEMINSKLQNVMTVLRGLR